MSERDDRLLTALRHAPDRDALPPPEVSERVLAAARAAVRPMRAAPLWRRWLEGLAQPRVAAAFGTLAIATIVGVMWATHEAPPQAVEPIDRAPSPVAERQAAPEAATPSPARTAVAAAPIGQSRQRPPPPVAAAAERATTEPRADLAVVPAAPAGKAAATQETVAAAPPAERAEAVAKTAAAAPPRLPVAQQAQPASSFALQAEARVADPGAALDASVQAGPAWISAGGRRAQGDAQRRWWAEARAATTGRWQAGDRAPVGTPALEWDATSGAVTRFWFDGDAIVCLDAQGRVWRAAVGAATVREWQAELARW